MEKWPEIDWDDCYPTDESLDALEAAMKESGSDAREAAAFLMRELPKCASNCVASCRVVDDMANSRPIKRIEFSTGGWSGAEQITGLIEGRFDLSHFMFSWQRGGHYVFEVPDSLLTRP